MIVLSNGVRIFIDNSMHKDIYLGISRFGFENDIYEVLGIAHLLEHILIDFDSSKFIANASTARSYMSFWCNSIKGKSTFLDSVKRLISWFFYKDKIRDSFSISKIKYHIKELENEYYFRNEVFHCMDVLTFLIDGDLYNGGRISMLNNINDISIMLHNRMHRIIGPNIIIFVKDINDYVLSILEKSFGSLPSCPLTIPYMMSSHITGKIIMMPSPFYTIMINIKSTLDNILSIMCLYEIYHLIDYETVGDQLYITISFIDEKDYESILKGISRIRLHIDREIMMKHTDDFLMNIYLCFPWIRNDIIDYWTDINYNIDTMLQSLNEEIYMSILQGEYIAIYPNFSDIIFNTKDRQMHKLVIMDTDINNSINNQHTQPNYINLMKKQTYNEIYIKYGDTDFIDYVNLALGFKHTIQRNNDGIKIRHQFSSDDIRTILESDVFLKYSKSKPAAMYQYLMLSFFVSGNTIEDILSNRESVLRLCKKYNNKIIFGKRTRYDIQTYSSFVCGIVKGSITNELLTNMMWSLKKKGLIYSLEFTKLKTNIFYIFMFTIYPDDVFKYVSSKQYFKSYCIVVSNKGDYEDFSSMKKDIVIKLS
ncbi:SPV047 putative metalloprotease [Swinepox virus]|uniref:Metalloendopeptidase n=1 Tax=Swinepox virus (strain Swine/Nebraska/17077-99/1999) TaxID=300880 RepID=Q8V3P7_SWPV1|nr:putative metalloprotease [Swinepox virus]AAL69786.1 SPV047 putative metalloprotease [Swinepox virus]UED36556.1 putative metalloprotease [Swinepox virus]UED36705.1 putative metalloprotease [Swinepox virus]UUA44237.1 SPV047 [Swinepox virus]